MPGERKNNKNTSSRYGTLNMRSYVIYGNDIAAFYDFDGNLIFVLDKTVNARKPNVLLVINPDGDKKWDEILSGKYGIDLETIRPKQDNKYQKLDIEYSGLNVYQNLIVAYDAGSEVSDYLTQLEVLRDSSVRHSAVSRLNMANDIIVKTNATIIKTKETINELQTRLKTLRAKLVSYKKEIGKVSTKQSAAKILRIESQIEATNEKLKRAKKRLESAQRRLEVATNDADIASNLLNQPEPKYTAPVSKTVVAAPSYPVQTTEPEKIKEDDEYTEPETSEEEDDDNNDVQPLFDKDPDILNEDIAFKPISFDMDESELPQTTPVVNFEEAEEPEETVSEPEEDFVAPVSFEPVVEPETTDMPPIINTQALFDMDKKTESESVGNMDKLPIDQEKSVLETMTPVYNYEEPAIVEEQNPIEVRPVTEVVEESENNVTGVEPEVPGVQPVENNFNEPVKEEVKSGHYKPTFAYYLLLIVLILLSVFTLWLYQKSMGTNTPDLRQKTEETVAAKEENKAVVEPDNSLPEVVEEVVFLDEPETNETNTEQTVVEEPVVEIEQQPTEEVQQEEPVVNEEPTEEIVAEPVVEEEPVVSENEPEPEAESVSEPEPVEDAVLESDASEELTEEAPEEIVVDKPEYDAGSKNEEMFVVPEDAGEFVSDEEDVFYDAEEAEYQSEQESLE